MCQAENNHWCWKVIYYSSEWEEILIFANDETSKGLASKIYKWFMCLNIQKTNNLTRKNEGMESKKKQHPVVDVTGDRSKV